MLDLLNAVAKLDRLETLIVLEECANSESVVDMVTVHLVNSDAGGRALVDQDGQTLYILHERNDELSFQRGLVTHARLNDTLALLGTGKSGRGLAEGDWIGSEQLSNRTAAIDQAFVMIRLCRDVTASEGEAVKLASEVLVLSQRWRVVRDQLFSAGQRAWVSQQSRAKAEEQEQSLLADLAAFHQSSSSHGVRIVLESDPRGSAVLVEFSGESSRTIGLVGLSMNWLPHSAGTDAPGRRRAKSKGPQSDAPSATKVPDDVAEVLRTVVCEGNTLRIAATLDPKLYARVDKILKGMGAKWVSKERAHVFKMDAAPVIAAALGSGEITTDRDWEFFETQPSVVAKMLGEAGLQQGMKVLEPEAGAGAIALEAAKLVGKDNVHCFELMPRNAATLARLGFRVGEADFLSQAPVRMYDVVLMNPPFANMADTLHIEHAAKWLKPGGRLVAISSTSWQTRSTARAKDFRKWLEGLNASIEELPRGAFRESGTEVATLMITMTMPKSAEAPKQAAKAVVEQVQVDLFEIA